MVASCQTILVFLLELGPQRSVLSVGCSLSFCGLVWFGLVWDVLFNFFVLFGAFGLFFVGSFKAPELSHFFLSDKAPVSTEFRHFSAFLAPSGPVGIDPRSVLVYTCDPSTQGRGRMISGLGSLGNDETVNKTK